MQLRNHIFLYFLFLHFILIVSTQKSDPIRAGGKNFSVIPSNGTQRNVCESLFGVGQESLSAIASPNYPQLYPPNQDCVRVIQASPGYDIVVKFNFFFQVEGAYGVKSGKIEYDELCPNDFVEFRDGRYGFSRLIGRFCGNEIPREEIRAITGFLWIRFHSDEFLQYKGFHASYEMVRASVQRPLDGVNECHFEVHNALDGWIDSQAVQHVRQGAGELECVWRVEIPRNLSISLFFIDFDLAHPNHCEDNFVEVFAGTTGTPIRRFCGLSASNIFSSSSVLFLRLRLASARLLKETRVRALFSSYKNDKNCSLLGMFSCGDGKCIPRSLICNNNHNCPYAFDETQCRGIASPALTALLSSGYFPLIMLIVLVFISVVSLYIWSFHSYLCNLCGTKNKMQRLHEAPEQNGKLKKETSLIT
ncbi:unnamed protein product, partial [Mesorhabditis belari]|uniref:CUB domain-containing protein n=1 Tax=Mesorhabditis belari TaxID=2138241 RepID=A0AAF3ED88_9BILA